LLPDQLEAARAALAALWGGEVLLISAATNWGLDGLLAEVWKELGIQ
jgi:ribosome-interacting GTPase 1